MAEGTWGKCEERQTGERGREPLWKTLWATSEQSLTMRKAGGRWEFSDYHEDCHDHQCCHHSRQQLSG